MSKRLLLCEGPEDLAALREILRVHFSATKSSELIADKSERSEWWLIGDKQVRLLNAQDKERVLRIAAELITSDSPSDPVVSVGLSFDPNGHDETQWRAWFEHGLRTLVLRLRTEGSSYEANPPKSYEANPPNRIPLGIIPLPWQSSRPPHYGLRDSHCLERCAIDALSNVYPSEHARVGRWIEELRAEQSPEGPSWKTAARLWNAVVLPKFSGPGFYSQVFGNHAALRPAVLAGMEDWNLRAALELLLF